jgi:hypothetical protein
MDVWITGITSPTSPSNTLSISHHLIELPVKVFWSADGHQTVGISQIGKDANVVAVFKLCAFIAVNYDDEELKRTNCHFVGVWRRFRVASPHTCSSFIRRETTGTHQSTMQSEEVKTEKGEQFHRFSVFGTIFEVTPRYYDLQPIGMGAFGLVWCVKWHDLLICSSAKDRANGGASVAIKKILKPFSTPVLAKRTYRELKLLKHFRHDNIISLYDVFLSPLEDIYFVTELLGTDLHRLLTSRPLQKQFVQYFLYQILVRVFNEILMLSVDSSMFIRQGWCTETWSQATFSSTRIVTWKFVTLAWQE